MANIVNIFAKFTFKTTFDLLKLKFIFGDYCKYDPRKFTGLILKFHDPKATFLIFHTGNVVGTGIKTEKNLDAAVRLLYKTLKETGLFVDLIFPIVQITNFTASCNIGSNLNLETLYNKYKSVCTYEKELFPGLKMQLTCPKMTIIIFHKGKLIFTGTANSFIIRKVYLKVLSMISEYNMP